MLSRYELTVYADPDGEIDTARLKNLISLAESVTDDRGTDVEYVAPIGGGDPQPWGLRIVIEGSE